MDDMSAKPQPQPQLPLAADATGAAGSARKTRSAFTRQLQLTVTVLVAVALAFVLYAASEKGIDRANLQRYQSYLLADELRQSSDDLTRMARSYVVTLDPQYKQYYQHILDCSRAPRATTTFTGTWCCKAKSRPAR